MTILYVEDDSELRENFSEVLKIHYENVYVASDGLEAKILFDRLNPEIVITDICMPKMNGLEFGAYVKSQNKNTYLIVTTAHTDSENLYQAINIGVDKFFIKPLSHDNFNELFNCILPSAVETSERFLASMNHLILLQKICNNINFGIMMFDNTYKIQKINHFLSCELGYSPEELLSTEFFKIIYDSTSPFIQNIFKKNLINKSSDICHLIKKDKNLLPVEASILVFNDSKMNPSYIMTFRDISKELLLQEDQRIKEAMLIQQNKLASMGEVLTMVAHQWRQPLNSLNIMLGSFQDKYDFHELNDEYIQHFITDIKAKVSFMSHTIDNFRNFFQPSKNQESFCAYEAIQNVVDIIKEELALKNVKISQICNIRNDGGCMCTKKIHTYKNSFKQVLLNLINNAKDALFSSNTENGLICIRIYRENTLFKVCITDNAGGIPDHVLPHLFKPYFTTKGPKSGTGLGLYMSKMIVEQHLNGTLVACNKDDGASFCITIST